MTKWAGVVRLGGVGDNLIASSVLPQLKKQGLLVEVICQQPHSVIFEHNPYIDRLVAVKDGHFPKDQKAWQEWFANRGKEFERFYNLSHSIEYLLAFMPEQTGFNSWPASFRRKWCDRSYLEVAHDICEVPHEYEPQFYPTDEEFCRALETKAKIGRRVIGWHIAGTRIDKIYPYAPMAIARLIKELGIPVVLFGAPSKREIESRDTIVAHVRRQNGSTDGLHSAISEGIDQDTWPLRRGLSQLQLCDLVIGPDTGSMWAVSMCQMPKILLLGHASPKNISTGWINTTTLHPDPAKVDCWPCHQLHLEPSTCRANVENNGAACISDITIERIMEVARDAVRSMEALDARRSARTEDHGERLRADAGRPARGRAARGNGRADAERAVPVEAA